MERAQGGDEPTGGDDRVVGLVLATDVGDATEARAISAGAVRAIVTDPANAELVGKGVVELFAPQISKLVPVKENDKQ